MDIQGKEGQHHRATSLRLEGAKPEAGGRGEETEHLSDELNACN